MREYSYLSALCRAPFFQRGVYQDAALRWRGIGMPYLLLVLLITWLVVLANWTVDLTTYINTRNPRLNRRRRNPQRPPRRPRRRATRWSRRRPIACSLETSRAGAKSEGKGEGMLIELVMAVAVVVAMVKIADMENRSPFIWGAVAVLAVLLCFGLPIPFFRIVIAGVISYGAMFIYKVAADR